MGKLLQFFLPFLILGLVVFILKVPIPLERFNVYWLMGIIFHTPLILAISAAILVEIMDSRRKK
jgi:hypothetical protein